MFLDTFLQPSGATRLLHLLQAAQPFLTPSWCKLADLCIRFLSITELVSNPQHHNFQRLFLDARNCSPTENMDALLSAIRPFCLEEELKLLQMFEQFQQMQKAMDLWKMFSDLAPDIMPDMDIIPNVFRSEQDTADTPPIQNQTENDSAFLAFLSPEQRALYDSILADDDNTESAMHS